MKHPAPYSVAVFDRFVQLVEPGWTVLDPFAGTGRIHRLPYAETWGIEIEPEWAAMHPRTLIGDALYLPFAANTFDAVFTSPCYGNRMADHHEAKEFCRTCLGEGEVAKNFGIGSPGVPEIIACPKCGGTGHNTYKRITYKHSLGRDLHPKSLAGLQWGQTYRKFHERAWAEVWRVLKPGCSFFLNVSDHIRKGAVQGVPTWHRETCVNVGFVWHKDELVETPRMKFGANRDLRVEYETIMIFAKP